jgi:hypothetical protein
MTRWQIALLVVAAAAMAAFAAYAAPRAIEAAGLLRGDLDPAELADRKIARVLDPQAASREIESALTANDADLAQSFLDLAEEHHVSVAPQLAERVAAATAAAHSASQTAENFARGLITGTPDDTASFAGTAVGDLFVFGDVRDAVRESARLISGEPADRLVLGLACVGLAVTAGTYAMLGSGAPVRIGLTVAKAARKTGRLGGRLAEWLGRSLREVVDGSKFEKAIAGASIAHPAAAVRAAREAVKLERTDGILDLVRNVGRVQSKAGTQAALDGLKLANGPQDVARIAKLAEKKGSKTRAILKLLGGGAFVLATGTMQLTSWLLWAALALFGFAATSKAAVERITLWHLRRRKQRSLANEVQQMRNRRLAAIALRG